MKKEAFTVAALLCVLNGYTSPTEKIDDFDKSSHTEKHESQSASPEHTQKEKSL